jgi:TRAP-type C4-dicarboxylate transport system permease small subunit
MEPVGPFGSGGRLGAKNHAERGGLARVKKAIQKLNRVISGVGAVFLLPMMLLTTGEVIGRNLFNRPIAGTVELSEYLLAIFILLGVAYTQQVKGYVGVSLFVSRLPFRGQMILNIVSTLLSLFIFALLAWQGLIVGMEEKTVSDMLRVPQYPFRLLIAMAAFLTCLELLIDVGDSFSKLFRRSSEWTR